jgi:Intracellular proteinase inhibitor
MNLPWFWTAGVLWVALIVGFSPTDGRSSEAPALVLRLEVPASMRVGTPVSFELTLQNTSKRAVTLTLGGRPAYDVVVATPEGQEIWRWSHGEAIQQILERKPLKAGEALEFTAVWGQRDNAGTPIPAGTYQVRGVVKLDPPEQLETVPMPLSLSP